MARRSALVLAALLAAAPAPVLAQAKVVRPSQAQIDKAGFTLKVMMGALQSKQVELSVKDALFGCLYQNSIAKITEAVDKVIAANPAQKIDRKNPTQMLGIIAGTCGYRPAVPAAKK